MTRVHADGHGRVIGALMRRSVSFTLNGKPVLLETDEKRSLLWALRTDLGLTGTKYGCGVGLCGSCTVVVDGMAVRSCRATLADVQDKKVTTIEGLAAGDQLHPIQQAFVDHGGFQCGYCTPGMIMNAYGLLLADPHPSREKVIDTMEGNLCRCSAYKRILEAIESVARKEGGRP
jgi:aerobic-type carbon monoxide dehydrogenase small subunit (CoxS/CutS family)